MKMKYKLQVYYKCLFIVEQIVVCLDKNINLSRHTKLGVYVVSLIKESFPSGVIKIN